MKFTGFAAKHLKFTELRAFQLTALKAYQDSRDILILQATSSGKSACFQIPALMQPPSQYCIIIVPINALGYGHKEEFSAMNVPAVFLNSTSTKEDYDRAFDPSTPKASQVKAIITTPETLFGQGNYRGVMAKIDPNRVSFIAIDEAHLVYEWNLFRSVFDDLARLKTLFKCPILALTATLKPSRLEKMAAVMLRDPVIIKGKVNRPNVAIKVTSYVVSADDGNDVEQESDQQEENDQNYEEDGITQSGQVSKSPGVSQKKTKSISNKKEQGAICKKGKGAYQKVNASVQKKNEATEKKKKNQWMLTARQIQSIVKKEKAIVYCGYTEDCNSLSLSLSALGIPAASYTGKNSNTDKQEIYANVQSNVVQVLVATKAFGMGVNIPDVRHIIAVGLPESLSLWAQESGRGGRDGNQAYAHLLVNEKEDIKKLQYWTANLADTERKAVTEDFLVIWRYYCTPFVGECMRRFQSTYFGDDVLERDGSDLEPQECCIGCEIKKSFPFEKCDHLLLMLQALERLKEKNLLKVYEKQVIVWMTGSTTTKEQWISSHFNKSHLEKEPTYGCLKGLTVAASKSLVKVCDFIE